MSIHSIYAALIRAGMTAEGACGLMGNMQAESAMRSNNVEDRSGIRDEDYTARVDNDHSYDFVNDGGKHYGYGLCQWTLPSRKRALLAFSRSRGASIGDEDMQVKFCINELQTQFGGVWATLTNSHNLYECTAIVCKVYENPAVHNVDARYNFATEFYNSLAGGEVKPVDDKADSSAGKNTVKNWDWKVAVIQFVMQCDGYWGKIDGLKSKDFFVCLEQYVKDMQLC